MVQQPRCDSVELRLHHRWTIYSSLQMYLRLSWRLQPAPAAGDGNLRSSLAQEAAWTTQFLPLTVRQSAIAPSSAFSRFGSMPSPHLPSMRLTAIATHVF